MLSVCQIQGSCYCMMCASVRSEPIAVFVEFCFAYRLKDLPRDVQMMNSADFVLHVRARTELWGACKNKAFFAFSKLFKHLRASLVGLGVPRKANLIAGNTALYQVLLYGFVHRKMLRVLVNGNVAEYYLHTLFIGGFVIIFFKIIKQLWHLTVGRGFGISENAPRIKSQKSCFVGYAQHIVLGGVNVPTVNCFGTPRQFLHICLLQIIRLCTHNNRLSSF